MKNRDQQPSAKTVKTTSSRRAGDKMSPVREQPVADPEVIRLQVMMARCGVGSRRDCEELISTGRVTVDGEVVEQLGACVRPDQKVSVDGESIRPERKVYYMVNKPKGLICTNEDPHGRSRVIDMFPKNSGRLFTVGRLDENSVGLLLVTNDGELAYRLAHPKFRVPKTYKVQVAGIPTPETIVQLRRGIHFSDGKFKIEGVRDVKRKGRSSILEVVLLEGQNREVRRLFARVGHKVMQLERVGFGPLRLKAVPLGRFRPLTAQERTLLLKYSQQPVSSRKTPEEEPLPPRPPKPVVPVEKGPALVEVTAVTRRGRRDMTGRRVDRLGQPVAPQRLMPDFDRDDDEPLNDLSQHPAFGGRSKAEAHSPEKRVRVGSLKSKPGATSAGRPGGKTTFGGKPGRKSAARKPGPQRRPKSR